MLADGWIDNLATKALKRCESADLIGPHQAAKTDNISGKTIPTTPAVINGADVLTINKSKVQQFIGRAIGTIAPNPHKHKNPDKKPKPIDSKCVN